MATTPDDADARLDRTLREVLQPKISEEGDQRIRARLDEQPVPSSPPNWLLQSQKSSGRAKTNWRWALLGAAAVLVFACGLVLIRRAAAPVRPVETTTPPEVTRDTPPPPNPKLESEPQGNVVEKTEPPHEGPAVLGGDYKSPLLHPVKPPEAPKK